MSRRDASDALVGVRTAVARSLADLPEGSVVLVGCSGGPDSLALAGASAWVGARHGLTLGAVVVDHGLQAESAAVAASAAGACQALGVPADVVRVVVGTDGGPEAAARSARYAALEEAASSAGASAVLLGHTREDQAETVLLRLARGSGARSLAAMSRRNGLWRRPLLDVPRAVVHQAARELLAPLGESAWSDPHNADRSFARVRVRALLDGLVADLGPGVVLGLARSAELLRDDADTLDAIAADTFGRVFSTIEAEEPSDAGGDLPGVDAACTDLAALPTAVRTRVERLAALAAGCPSDALGVDHVRRLDALVTDWRGQGEVALPGGVVGRRRCGRLGLHPS